MTDTFDWEKYGQFCIPHAVQSNSTFDPPQSWQTTGSAHYNKLRKELQTLISKKIPEKAFKAIKNCKKMKSIDNFNKRLEIITKSGHKKFYKTKHTKKMHLAFQILSFDFTDNFVNKKFNTKEELLFHVYEMHKNVPALTTKLKEMYLKL